VTHVRARRTALAIACTALAWAPNASAAPCANADLAPTAANLDAVAHTTICLINAERRKRHLRALRRSASLTRAAVAHARDMVDRRYFSHETPAGLSAIDRARRAGYVGPGVSLLVAEDLSWGSEGDASPRQTVRRWMHSPPHRRNILTRSYRHIGIGVAPGSPGPAGGGATYTAEFGRRY
jgi:uncharacterized protein YkwD